MMWQLSWTLLKKLKQLAAQFYCFRTKIKIKPIRAEIFRKQAYSHSFFQKEKRQTIYKKIVSEQKCCSETIGEFNLRRLKSKPQVLFTGEFLIKVFVME